MPRKQGKCHRAARTRALHRKHGSSQQVEQKTCAAITAGCRRASISTGGTDTRLQDDEQVEEEAELSGHTGRLGTHWTSCGAKGTLIAT